MATPLKINMDEYEVLSPKEVGVYLSDKRDSINASEFDDADDVRFNYETGIENKDKHDYFAKRYIPERFREKRNVFTSVGRGAWTGAVNFPKGLWNSLLGAAEWGLVHVYADNEEEKQRYMDAANALRAKNEAWAESVGFVKDDKDSSFAFDLGQGGSSVFASIGLALATKNPSAVATMFGLQQYGELNSEMRQRGMDIDRANAVAAVGGLFEGGLEKFGLHYFIENMATKKLGAYLAKQPLTEFVQEASQTGAEEVLMGYLGGERVSEETGKPKTVTEIAVESIYSGVIGAIIGFGGGVISIPATRKSAYNAKQALIKGGMDEAEASQYVDSRIYGSEEQRQELVEKISEVAAHSEWVEKINKEAQEAHKKQIVANLKERGIDEEKAAEIAEMTYISPSEAREILIEMLNKEADFDTFENGSPQAEAQRFMEEIQVDAAAEAFDIHDQIKEQAISEGGLNEEEAEAAATLTANFAMTVYNRTGETPMEWFERKGLTVVDERINQESREDVFELTDADEIIDESELSAEEIAQLEAAEERAAALEAEMGDIPFFQSGDNVELMEREDGPKIADDSEMVEVVKLSENAIPDFKTKRELVTFIKEILGSERNITIKSTGDVVLVSNGAINRVASKTRSQEYNEAFSAVKQLLENAKYSGFEMADARHQNVRGQDVYHSALLIGTKPYAVQFKVDVPLEQGTHNYAGHRISDIKIASPENAVERFTSPMQSGDAINTVSIAVLRGKVNPARYNKMDKSLYQSADTTPRASYTPKTRVIHLFKNANHSSIIHELGHLFTIDYVNLLEEQGDHTELQGFYNWLGIENISQANTETWEKMARGFETYVMEGEAPNAATESLFTKFKNFLIGVYTDLRGKVIKPEEINDDVRQFFDRMLAAEENLPDISNLQGRIDDVRNVIKGALRGEEISVDGLSVRDLRNLARVMTARKPRKPNTLEQRIRAAGGIDINFAKQIGIYDEQKGNRNGFFRKDGYFTREDSLLNFLQDAGYMPYEAMETYEQNAALWDNAVQLLENAGKQYTIEEQARIEQRNEIERMAFEAMEQLKDINTGDIFKAISVLNKNGAVGVKKETLQYLNARLRDMERAYKQIKKDIKTMKGDIADKQAKIIDYIKKLDLSGEDRFKIMERIKRAKFGDEFDKVIDKVNALSKDFIEHAKKKLLVSMIDKEVKKSKPKETTKQKYDYENNKLFKDLREYRKLKQKQAAEMLGNIEINDEMSPEDLVRVHFLNYKSLGMKSSADLLGQVYVDIVIAKQYGEQAKSEADFEKAINREALKEEVMAAINKNTADKHTLRTQIANSYRSGLTNLYSMINSIASQKLARRFEMETVLNTANEKFYRQTEEMTREAIDIYGLKNKGDFLNKLAEMGTVTDKLYNVDGIKVEEISKMKIIDIYNAVKNEKTRQDYYDNYGEAQVDRLLTQLNDKDRKFADLMMEDINRLFPEVNRTYISIYGIDLPKVDNYWPATSEHKSDTDLLGDYSRQSSTPSSWKERVKGRVNPLPQNAWSKYLKHVNENIYMINTAVKYKELADTFKSLRIKNMIKNKYGDRVYGELMKQIGDLSLGAKSESLSYIDTVAGSFVNNMVVAKIAIAPSVFLGQLTSVTNYSENIKSGTFYKHFAAGLANPRSTIKFMQSLVGDFLEARYKGGYAESISNVLREAEDASSKRFRLLSPKMKYNTANALSSFVRIGDIGAIIFGGYAHIKSNLETGMSVDEAVQNFKFDTLRSQQSSNAASLSSWQKNKGAVTRMILAFKNTAHQYFRKLMDATISLQRGEISLQQYAKIVMNYAVVQPALYVIAKNLWKAALDLFDDDDDTTDLFDGVLEQMMVGTIDAIPFLSDILHYVYKQVTDQYAGSLVSMVGFDDIEKALRKFAKDDKDVYDWVEIVTPLVEGTTSLPVQRYERMFKKFDKE